MSCHELVAAITVPNRLIISIFLFPDSHSNNLSEPAPHYHALIQLISFFNPLNDSHSLSVIE